MSLGVGWGVTLSMSLKALGARPFERFSVISLLGGMTHSRAINPSAVARRIADAVGAECFQLTAPVFVASEATRNALWAEPGLPRTARARPPRRLAVVSVGDVSEDSTLFREGLLPRSQLASLIAAGAVGEVLCHFLDAARQRRRSPGQPAGGRGRTRRSAPRPEDRDCRRRAAQGRGHPGGVEGHAAPGC